MSLVGFIRADIVLGEMSGLGDAPTNVGWVHPITLDLFHHETEPGDVQPESEGTMRALLRLGCVLKRTPKPQIC